MQGWLSMLRLLKQQRPLTTPWWTQTRNVTSFYPKMPFHIWKNRKVSMLPVGWGGMYIYQIMKGCQYVRCIFHISIKRWLYSIYQLKNFVLNLKNVNFFHILQIKRWLCSISQSKGSSIHITIERWLSFVSHFKGGSLPYLNQKVAMFRIWIYELIRRLYSKSEKK